MNVVRIAELLAPFLQSPRHFGESFFAARQLFPSGGTVGAVDLGSGFRGDPARILVSSKLPIRLKTEERAARY